MHSVIIGRPETGKSSLAKAIIRQSQYRFPITVIDPLGDDWPTGYIFSEMERAIEHLKGTSGHVVIIDESSQMIERFNKDHLWLGKVSRHNGHQIFFIGQNLVDIPRGIRTMCPRVFAFACSISESHQLANEYGCKYIDISRLAPLHFLMLDNRRIIRGRVDPIHQKIYLQKT